MRYPNRSTVEQIVRINRATGAQPEEVARDNPGLTLAQVHAVFDLQKLYPKVYDARPAARATPEVEAEEHLYALRWDAQYRIDSAARTVGSTIRRLREDPASALEWAGETFRDAARDRAARYVMRVLDHLESRSDEYETPSAVSILASLATEMNSEARRRASDGGSTSAASNEMARCLAVEFVSKAQGVCGALARIAPERLVGTFSTW